MVLSKLMNYYSTLADVGLQSQGLLLRLSNERISAFSNPIAGSESIHGTELPCMEIYPFFIDPQPKYKSYPYIKNN